MMLFADIDVAGSGSAPAVIIGAVGIVLVQLLTIVINYLREDAKIKRELAMELAKIKREQELADRVESVREQAEQAARLLKASNIANAKQLNDIAVVGQKTHDLCNSAMLEQKRIYMVKCQASASADATPANIAEARASTEAYEEHKKKQATMEAKEAKEAK